MTSSGQHAAIAPSRPGAERTAAPAPRAAGFAQPAPAHGAPGAILGLQRGAGNHATAELITNLRLSHAPTAVLQRCGSHPCPSSRCHPDAEDAGREVIPDEPGTAARPALARTAVHGGAGGGRSTGYAPPLVDSVLRSGGQPLDAASRTAMESPLRPRL